MPRPVTADLAGRLAVRSQRGDTQRMRREKVSERLGTAIQQSINQSIMAVAITSFDDIALFPSSSTPPPTRISSPHPPSPSFYPRIDTRISPSSRTDGRSCTRTKPSAPASGATLSQVPLPHKPPSLSHLYLISYIISRVPLKPPSQHPLIRPLSPYIHPLNPLLFTLSRPLTQDTKVSRIHWTCRASCPQLSE